MRKYLFSSKATRVFAVLGATAAMAVPASSASASLLGSSTLLVTAQGTSILGQEVPLLGTQGWYITLPVGSNVLPGETIVWGVLDFTVKSEVKLGNYEIAYLYIDPNMVR
jgi:uncharacterized oligopeptide transporter (OPT) family protein